MKQLQIVILSKELFTSELRKTNTDKRFGSNSMDFKLLQCFFNFKVLSIVIMANSQTRGFSPVKTSGFLLADPRLYFL